MKRSTFFPFALLLFAVVVAGCDTTVGPDDEPEYEVQRIEDLPADPAVNTGGGRPTGSGRFAFFNLRDSTIVLSSSAADRADSSSTEWDIAFQSTNIIINGGDSGPGETAGYIAEQAFGEVQEVDTDRLETDSAEDLVLADWYNYNTDTHVVSPLPGRTLVLRTADGESYAKIRIMSYYEGAPADPASSDADSRYYNFEYILSDDTTFE